MTESNSKAAEANSGTPEREPGTAPCGYVKFCITKPTHLLNTRQLYLACGLDLRYNLDSLILSERVEQAHIFPPVPKALIQLHCLELQLQLQKDRK